MDKSIKYYFETQEQKLRRLLKEVKIPVVPQKKDEPQLDSNKEYSSRIYTEKLKPCPFCGGCAVLSRIPIKGAVIYMVNCESCLAQIRMSNGYDDMSAKNITAWNRRKGQ